MQRLKIAVFGAGRMGEGLARLWVSAGHDVILAFSRRPSRLFELAAHLGPRAHATEDPSQAARWADVWLVATWPAALPDLIRVLAPVASDKVVLSCSSALRPDFSGSTLGLATDRIESLAEELARLLPGSRVVEAFNITFAETLASPLRTFGGGPPSIFICGDHPDANGLVRQLVEAAGFEAVEAGALRVARSLETLATAWVQFAVVSGLFPQVGLRALRPTGTPGHSP